MTTKYRIVPLSNLQWGIEYECTYPCGYWRWKRLFGWLPVPFWYEWIEESPYVDWERVCCDLGLSRRFNTIEEAKCFIDLEIKTAKVNEIHLATPPLEYP